ncbi:MAG: 4-hydroxy-tetrahydrodipicolinate reductase [Chitinophagaceae bacterium]|nr:4-hydroxy-tetrahydrodipicolinate reductase [Oligoflexus sp.]
MKAWIHGYSGRMGQEILKQIHNDPQWTMIGGSSARGLYYKDQEGLSWDRFENLLSEAEVLIDFSSVSGNEELYQGLLTQSNISAALIIGSTGLTAEAITNWETLAGQKKMSILLAPNTSLGILLLHQISKLLGEVLSPLHFDIEILESHHRAKLDAPSGTAKFLANGLAHVLGKKVVINREGLREPKEIGVTALRGGSVFGEHDILFLGDEEEMRISHRALSRGLFAKGALLLAKWIEQQKPGFYRLEDIRIEDMIALIKTK